MIETRDLTKMYGELYALDRLTLKLERGDVYGFIGPNGAGKTTTMRILATLLNPTWGEATVCGYSIYNGAKDIRRVWPLDRRRRYGLDERDDLPAVACPKCAQKVLVYWRDVTGTDDGWRTYFVPVGVMCPGGCAEALEVLR